MTNRRIPAGRFWASMLLAISLGLSGCGPGQLFSPPTTPDPNLPPLNAKLGDMWVSPKDGMTLVYIPAGEFLMGSANGDGEAFSNEKPRHRVYLDAYWIDQTEVTQGMYAKCVAAGNCMQPNCSHGGDNYPVVCMGWDDAAAYCAWAGRRLPTEAEWEKAARGTDGRKYPWGNQPPDSGLLNFNRNVGNTTEVGHYLDGASPYGALDMAANVTEWVADWYDANYYASSPSQNPSGPSSGEYRVLRGGSWSYDSLSIRLAIRYGFAPDRRNDCGGFRCAR